MRRGALFDLLFLCSDVDYRPSVGVHSHDARECLGGNKLSPEKRTDGNEQVDNYEEPANLLKGPVGAKETEQAERETRREKREVLQVVFNALLILTSITTGAVALYQIKLATIAVSQTERILGEMKLQTASGSKSAEASAESVQATRDAMKSGDVTFQQEQRPWVMVSEMRYGRDSLRGVDLVSIVLENHGKSPAQRTAYFANAVLGDRVEVVKKIRLPRSPKGYSTWTPLGTEVTIMPQPFKRYFTTLINRPLTPYDERLVQQEELNLVVYGTVFYEDRFKNKYETQFCADLIRLAPGLMRACDTGNEIK